MARVHELARSVSVYHNRGDAALVISDFTKGNPDRLGSNGPARPAHVHNKVHQVDCTPLVKGLVEHSYYLVGHVNADIRMSIDGAPHDDPNRHRNRLILSERMAVQERRDAMKERLIENLKEGAPALVKAPSPFAPKNGQG